MNTLHHILSKIPGDDLPNSRPIQIPNVSRLDLVRWLRELDFQIGAEIGVADGELSKIICEINPQMKLYGVDAWQSYNGYKDYKRQSTFRDMERQTEYRMRPYIKRGRYEIVKKWSMDALSDFPDGGLDF